MCVCVCVCVCVCDRFLISCLLGFTLRLLYISMHLCMCVCVCTCMFICITHTQVGLIVTLAGLATVASVVVVML